MQLCIPRTLRFNNRFINYAGAGRAPGGHMFLDAATGRTYELFFAQIDRVGPHYSLAVVFGNGAVGKVRVDHSSFDGVRSLGIGDMLIVGPLSFLPEGPKAEGAWLARAVNSGARRPTRSNGAARATGSGRQTGVITRVADQGSFGWIASEQTGRLIFVHASQLKRGAVLQPGSRVSFVEAMNDRGPTAYDVWPG
jgi:cold shock CspA family protein